MSPENRNNTPETNPSGQMDLFTELNCTEFVADVPNPRTVEVIKERVQSGSQSIARLETTWREDSEEDRLIDQGVTNRAGARIMTGSEVSRQLPEKKSEVSSPYLPGKNPGYKRSKKGRNSSSRVRMLGDVAPKHIRDQYERY